MKLRELLLDAVRSMDWANCFEIVEAVDDGETTVAIAAKELRAMVAEGILQSRAFCGRSEYAIAEKRSHAAPLPPPPPPAELATATPAAEASATPALATLPHKPVKYGPVQQKVIAFLRSAPGPFRRLDISRDTGLSLQQISDVMFALKRDGIAESPFFGAWRATPWQGQEAAIATGTAQPIEKVQPETAKPAAEECAQIDAVDERIEIPHVPTARIAADELSPIREAVAGEALPEIDLRSYADVSRPLVRDQLGLHSRAEAVITDIEDLLGDACDRQLDHALIKALVTANGAMQRAARRLAQA